MIEGPPETRDCDGAIDQVDGQSPVPADLRVGSVMAISGWSALSAKEGVLPDEVFVVLRSAGAEARYVPTQRMLRPDVRDHFGQPGLLRSGFVAFTDTSALSGPSTLHLAQRVRRTLIHCRPVHTLITGG
jgi:hypothetical protein